MQGVLEDVGELVSFVAQNLESHTYALLSTRGISPESVAGLGDVFSGPGTKPFDGLQSFHQQLQYCRTHLKLTVSNLIELKSCSSFVL